MAFRILIRNLLLACATGSLGASAIAQTIPPTAEIQAEPAGKWTIEYGDWQCVLHRDLSVAGQPATFSLAMEPLTPTAWLRIGVRGGGGRKDGNDAVMFMDGKRVAGALHYNAFAQGPYRVREYLLDLEKQNPDGLKDKVRFWTSKGGDIEANLDGFQAGLAALRKCMNEFYADLGVTNSDLAQIAKPARGNALSFVNLPIGPNQSMDMALFFWINAAGRVEKCQLLKPSGHKDFDATLCSLLEAKAVFTPATNAAGAAIRVPHYEHDDLRVSTFTTTTPL